MNTNRNSDANVAVLEHSLSAAIIPNGSEIETRIGLSELLDVSAVAALLMCSERHVWRLSDTGAMPAPLRIGRLVRWSRRPLTEWIDGGCKPVRIIQTKS